MATRKEDGSVDVFTKNRIIYFNGSFTESKVHETIRKLLEFEVDAPGKDIIIFIDSNGGFVDSFFAIHDTIRMLRSDIVTVCLGKAMSAGMLLLMSGKRGKRFITKRSRVLVHELSAGTIGKLSDMDIDLREAQRMQDEINKLVLEYTDVKEEDLESFMSKDTYCDAEAAQKLGIVDHVIETYDELFRKINS